MMERLQELVVSVVTSNPLLERLTAASIDLIVVTALVAAVVALARIRSRRVVALLWLIALTKPVVSLAVGAPTPLIPIVTPVDNVDVMAQRAVDREVEITVASAGGNTVVLEQARELGSTTSAHDNGATAGTTAAAVWVLGVMTMAGLSFRDRRRLRRVIAASEPASDAIAQRCRQLVAVHQHRRAPRVLVTPGLESPALAGTLRPVILIPAWMADAGHDERLDWALRHELAHWSAHDHLANLASEVARTLFFFHPLAWWTARRWKEAMEMACDEAVVSNRRDVKRYAEQLYQILARVDERRRLAPTASLFATRTQIGRRIETLLRLRRPVARPGAAAIALVAVFATVSFAVGADFSRRAPEPPRAPSRPGLASLPEIPSPPQIPTPGVVMVQGGTAHYDNVNLFETDDDRELRLRAEGIEFDRATGRIIRFDDDGFLRVREITDGHERHVYVTAGDDGGLRYRYRVDDERAHWDAEAERWLARVLRTHLTRVRNHNRFVVAPPAPVAPTPDPVAAPPVPPAPAIEPAPEPVYKVHKRNR